MCDDTEITERPSDHQQETIQERLSKSKLDALPSGQQRRMESALEENFFTYPVAYNTYHVQTLDSDDRVKSEYTVSVFHRPICECMDYIIRCVGTDKWCKHILRVWAEIYVDELPGLGINPKYWLEANLRQLVLTYMDSANTSADLDKIIEPHLTRVRHAYFDISELEDPQPTDFERATYVWREAKTVLGRLNQND